MSRSRSTRPLYALQAIGLSMIGPVAIPIDLALRRAAAEPVSSFLQYAENYNDPLCSEWNDGCKTCRRDTKDLANVSCSDSNAACERHYTICTKINVSAAKRICDVIVINRNICKTTKNFNDYVCTKLPSST